MSAPAAPAALRRALSILVTQVTDPQALLIAADAMDEAAREAALLDRPNPDLPDMAELARHRAATLKNRSQA